MSQNPLKLNARVLLGIPTLGINRKTEVWIDGKSGLQMPLGSSLGLKWAKDMPIAEARNALCQAALDEGAEYLFMLGDDVIPPPNALLLMLDKIGRTYPVELRAKSEELEARASMITGVYWTKTYPPEPYIFRGLLKGTYKNWLAGEFFDIDMAGCDCLLIETEMLKQIPPPWFSTDWVWEKGQHVSPIATEDFYFYTKAREYGFRLFADTSIQCLHEDRHTGVLFGLSMEMVQAKGLPEVGAEDKSEVVVADIGSGAYTRSSLFGQNVRVVRFDIRPETNPDVRCDVRAIDPHWFGQFDVVHVSHVLEHFRRSEAPTVLAHWVQLLKPDGQLIIRVPNFERAVKIVLDPKGVGAGADEQNYAWAQVYGDQAAPGAAWQHLNGFTQGKLKGLLATVSELVDIEVTTEDEDQNLRAVAKLSKKPEPFSLTDAWARIEGEGEVKVKVAEITNGRPSKVDVGVEDVLPT